MFIEAESWVTSTTLIRHVFPECIELGCRTEDRIIEDLLRAFCLPCTGMQTLEGLLARSTWTRSPCASSATKRPSATSA